MNPLGKILNAAGMSFDLSGEMGLSQGKSSGGVVIVDTTKARTATTLTLLAMLSIVFGSSAHAQDGATGQSSLVEFFKNAMVAPPEIEKYLVKRTNLQLPGASTANSSPGEKSSFQYFEGALSGTNFYLRFLPDPSQPKGSNRLDTISARAGSLTYEVGGGGILYGIGENALKDSVQAQFRVARQILCMGAGELEPGTVQWHGSEFTAKNIYAKDVHGSLLVSNNLPFRTEFYLANEPHAYKAIEYTYPTPADSLAGYPAKFLIFYKNKEGLKPLAEVEFESVLLAAQKLSVGFFSETRFADLIAYTNVYSNSDFYASDTKSKKLVKVDPDASTGGFTNSTSRVFFYLSFTLVTLIPLGILLVWSVRKQRKKTNQ